MKKAIALLLTLILCLSLCACGDGNSPQNADEAPKLPAADEINTQIDYTTILMNSDVFWGYTNHSASTAFCEDGTTMFPDGTWKLDGSVVTCTWDDGSADVYEIRELNGMYYLVGERDTMYGAHVMPGQIPAKPVEINLDNWKDYFEFGSGSCEVFDQFGEPTGEVRTSHFLRLKDEYYRYLIETDSEVLLRFSINGEERDSRINGAYWDGRIETYYFGVDHVEIGENDVFEMVKIQGTIYLIDGL